MQACYLVEHCLGSSGIGTVATLIALAPTLFSQKIYIHNLVFWPYRLDKLPQGLCNVNMLTVRKWQCHYKYWWLLWTNQHMWRLWLLKAAWRTLLNSCTTSSEKLVKGTSVFMLILLACANIISLLISSHYTAVTPLTHHATHHPLCHLPGASYYTPHICCSKKAMSCIWLTNSMFLQSILRTNMTIHVYIGI